MQSMEPLILGVMSNTTLPKYRDLVLGCCETWVMRCDRVFFFEGENGDLSFEEEMKTKTNQKAIFIHLPGVGDDYESASYKQYLGWLYMYNNVPKGEWYGIIGTDNYAYPDLLLSKLQSYNSSKPYIVGGIPGVISLDVYIPFLMGGSGLYVTRSTIESLLEMGKSVSDSKSSDDIENIKQLHIQWKERQIVKDKKLTKACDVSVCYYCWQLGIPIICEPSFFPARDDNAHQFGPRLIVTEFSICHFMDRKGMLYHHSLDLEGIRKHIRRRFSEVDLIPIRNVVRNGKIGMCIKCPENYAWAFLDGLEPGSELYLQDCKLESFDSLRNIARQAGITCRQNVHISFVDVLCTTVRLKVYNTNYLILIGNIPIPDSFDIFGKCKDIVILKRSCP